MRNILILLVSGCGAVGRAVASDFRGPGFQSSHRLLLVNIFTVNCVVEKTKIKEKEALNGPLKANLIL